MTARLTALMSMVWAPTSLAGARSHKRGTGSVRGHKTSKQRR